MSKPTQRMRQQRVMDLTRLKLENDAEVNRLRRYSVELQRQIAKLVSEAKGKRQ